MGAALCLHCGARPTPAYTDALTCVDLSSPRGSERVMPSATGDVNTRVLLPVPKRIFGPNPILRHTTQANSATHGAVLVDPADSPPDALIPPTNPFPVPALLHRGLRASCLSLLLPRHPESMFRMPHANLRSSQVYSGWSPCCFGSASSSDVTGRLQGQWARNWMQVSALSVAHSNPVPATRVIKNA